MTWDYQKFPRHPVSAEMFGMRGRNTIFLNYNYRVDLEPGKGVCAIFWIPCACPSFVDQLDKYWLPTIPPSYQPKYDNVENCYYKKQPNITTIGSS